VPSSRLALAFKGDARTRLVPVSDCVWPASSVAQLQAPLVVVRDQTISGGALLAHAEAAIKATETNTPPEPVVPRGHPFSQ
jgi:hypothetical protein